MWVKLDDGFPWHPKVITAARHLGSPNRGGTALILGVFIEALCYCNRHLTDGHLTRAVVQSFSSDKNATRIMQVLSRRDVGLAHATRQGWQLHDYHEYQPSKAEIEKKRRKERNRKRRVRADKDRTNRTVREDKSHRPRKVAAPSADPDPIQPVPSRIDQNLDQDQRAQSARDSYAVIERLAYDAIREHPDDAKEALKDLCAQKGIVYEIGVITRALDSAEAQRRRSA